MLQYYHLFITKGPTDHLQCYTKHKSTIKHSDTQRHKRRVDNEYYFLDSVHHYQGRYSHDRPELS